ncbi:hypothetical protein BUALT_Bualt03G0147600 [Buddleja alternifolia]|uniref:Uncharacterized protein n=1 Tax=Buddleja alternifolia TaxID=168488 RepID=A0AAV6Y0H0_9LAMI|nr:hypothetical protein BUALT_Bualt03G0147600 [Buddleja alternifolia]
MLETTTEKSKAKVANKGKGKVADKDYDTNSRSEWDDSLDADYVLPEYNSDDLRSIDSDVPSIFLEDLEASSDDDIFLQKNPTKRQFLEKSRKIMESSQSQTLGPSTQTQNSVNSKDEEAEKWYSDPGDEEDYEILDSVEERVHKFPFLREGSRVKISHQLLGGFTFQIKTLSRVHHLCKAYVNNLAQAKYIGMRIENVIRDNPEIPIIKMKSMIKRKFNVETTKCKVIRAKKAAMDRIHVGMDDDANMWAIAIGFVQVENIKNWKLFLAELLEDIEHVRGLVFMTDRQDNDATNGSEILSQTTGVPSSSQAQDANMDPPSSSQAQDIVPEVVPSVVPSQIRRKEKQSTYGGKRTYVGRRNDALLGKQFGASTLRNSIDDSRIQIPPTTKKTKKASIFEVLQNIRKIVRK